MQHEIEIAQNEVKALEERILERMLEADDLAAIVKRVEGELSAEQKKVDAERRDMAAEHAELAASLAKMPRIVRRWWRRSTSRSWRFSTWCRSAGTVSPSPKHVTASAPSAMCGSGRRSSTLFGATTR